MPQSPVRPGAKVNELLASLIALDGGAPDRGALDRGALDSGPLDSGPLASVLRLERPRLGQTLSSRAEPATDVWFPNTAVIALSVTDREGRTVQTGIVGREGCVGLEAMYGRTPALSDAAVQVAGEISVVAGAHLRAALESRPAMQATISRFLCELSAQSLQTIACNRLHVLSARCCRWLLMMQDRTGEDDLPLTQETLATMLGGGRPRINAVLAALEQDGLVRRYRGCIRLQSREGLERRACECYRLLRPPPKVSCDL